MKQYLEFDGEILRVRYLRIKDSARDQILWVHPDAWGKINNTQHAEIMVSGLRGGLGQYEGYDANGRIIRIVVRPGDQNYELLD